MDAVYADNTKLIERIDVGVHFSDGILYTYPSSDYNILSLFSRPKTNTHDTTRYVSMNRIRVHNNVKYNKKINKNKIIKNDNINNDIIA